MLRKDFRMREKYESLSLGALKEIARARGMKGLSSLKKSELVERMLQEDEKDKKQAEKKEAKTEGKKDKFISLSIRNPA